MPFSLQVGASDVASVGTSPTLATGSMAGTQAASNLGVAFAALMQTALPGPAGPAGSHSVQGSSSLQQADDSGAPPRGRKRMADVPDPMALATVVTPLLVPSPVATTSAELVPVGVTNALDQQPNTPQCSGDTSQHDVSGLDQEATGDVLASPKTEEQTIDSSGIPPRLRDALPSALLASEEAVSTPSALQPSAPSRSLSSQSASLHTLRSTLTPSSSTAALGTTAKPVTNAADRGQQAQVDLPQSSHNIAATTGEARGPGTWAAMSANASRKLLEGDAPSLVPPVSSSSAQSSTTDMAAQNSYSSQGAPSIAMEVQTSSGDASPNSQDDTEKGMPAARKSGQGPTRSDTTLESDSRFGMSGWIASTQHLNSAASQQAGTESPPSASSGMTNMSLDRITSESSARRLTNALRSDMSFGVQTDAFGKINIQTALHGDQLASQISLEHAHLHASMLATHMPTLELKLGEKYNLDATVTVRDSGSSTSTSQQSPSQGDSRQNTAGAFPLKSTPTAAKTVSISAPSTEHQQLKEGFSPAAGRLDLVI